MSPADVVEFAPRAAERQRQDEERARAAELAFFVYGACATAADRIEVHPSGQQVQSKFVGEFTIGSSRTNYGEAEGIEIIVSVFRCGDIATKLFTFSWRERFVENEEIGADIACSDLTLLFCAEGDWRDTLIAQLRTIVKPHG